MSKIRAYWEFYKKLIVPSLALSVLFGLYNMYMNGSFLVTSIGLAYIFVPLLMHYFTYEIKNRNEYYFYHNLGLDRISLWISTFIISLVIAILLTIILWLCYMLIVS